MWEPHASEDKGFQERGDHQILTIQCATLLAGVPVSVGADNWHTGQGCLAQGLVLLS